ncbi:hypothetical protein NE612_01225 [Oscillibacter valericigenes]|jgi:hypothetical protein|nr:hypothetical protein [Oscillibacter valericigenes]
MRTATIIIDGQQHLLCFSTRVIRAVTERYGDIVKLYEAISTKDAVHNLDESIWLLAAMLDAGDRYARMHNLDNPAPLTAEQLYDACDISDFARLRLSIMETVTNGQKTHVEVEPPKNGEAAGAGA